MPHIDDIRAHWDKQAALGEKAGTQDLILKQLERRAILAHMPSRLSEILEVGCGTGDTAIGVAKLFPYASVLAADYAPKMIAAAKRKKAPNNLAFARADITALGIRSKFDVIYTQRCLINLPSWPIQHRAICKIASRLRAGGLFLMCEHSADGLVSLNIARGAHGLPPIEAPWHNRYFSSDEIAEVTCLRLLRTVCFSAEYYLLSRVINAALAGGAKPKYNAPVNRLALNMPAGIATPALAQGRLWVWEKP